MNLITLNFKVSQMKKQFRESKQKLLTNILIYFKCESLALLILFRFYIV
ncbi:unnamed protein product [Paramecium sonneborni]|uniref:Uncharacterized protein n=1 Tax=Paramecium sonneborni TaxID=65129 RepID=A0A8S1QHX5_9CILI|nr:unnamed protein product [Paramecium sonneborni]